MNHATFQDIKFSVQIRTQSDLVDAIFSNRKFFIVSEDLKKFQKVKFSFLVHRSTSHHSEFNYPSISQQIKLSRLFILTDNELKGSPSPLILGKTSMLGLFLLSEFPVFIFSLISGMAC